MKIAVLTIAFPELSETFVSREVYALAARGHDVTVYTLRDPVGPPATPSTVPVRRWPKADEPIDVDVLYGSLGFPAHVRTAEIARRQHLKYLLRVWEGFDAFTAPNPTFYRSVAIDPHSLGVVVEDAWCQKYAREQMALPSTQVIPNGIDTTVFVPGPSRTDPLVILSVARWVPKKGLIH
ncbi:MAG TPA: hypothetical protein VJ598_10865, partial [Albitalea sp.]|nr:hypothetical protein [Albitalea sp.]